MRFKIDHTTAFTYSEPVLYSLLELRLRPRTEGQQQCLSFKLTTTPPSQATAYRDGLGNAVHHFDIPQQHTELRLVSEAVVEIAPFPELPPSLSPSAWDALRTLSISGEFYDELEPSHYIQTTPALVAFTEQLGVAQPHSDPLTLLRQLNAAIKTTLRYDQRSTSVDSAIDVALELRGGVCQDYAHIMIAICRRLGIPARYVSGYLFHRTDQKDQSAEDASHAWIEAYLPGLGWIGFDPTNDLIAAERHVRVAVGRDYLDVPPVRGVLNGGGASTLEVGVRVAEAGPDDESAAFEMTSLSPTSFGGQQLTALAYAHQQQQQQQQQ